MASVDRSIRPAVLRDDAQSEQHQNQCAGWHSWAEGSGADGDASALFLLAVRNHRTRFRRISAGPLLRVVSPGNSWHGAAREQRAVAVADQVGERQGDTWREGSVPNGA